jgi:hypothetical protein
LYPFKWSIDGLASGATFTGAAVTGTCPPSTRERSRGIATDVVIGIEVMRAFSFRREFTGFENRALYVASLENPGELRSSGSIAAHRISLNS